MEDVALLKKMVLFKGLDSLEMVQVSKRIRHRKVEPDEVVAALGSTGNSLFMVRSGQLVVSVPRGETRELLGELGPGSHFGEISLIDHGPRSAEVRATSRSELLDFSPELKDRLCNNLLLDLCAKIRHTNDRLLHML